MVAFLRNDIEIVVGRIDGVATINDIEKAYQMKLFRRDGAVGGNFSK